MQMRDFGDVLGRMHQLERDPLAMSARRKPPPFDNRDQTLRDFTSVFVGRVPAIFGSIGNHDMEALAVRCLRPRIKPFLNEQVA